MTTTLATPELTTTKRIAVISAGLSRPSSTHMLAERLGAATLAALEERGVVAEVVAHDLRDHAGDIVNAMLTGFPSPKLEAVIDDVIGADGLIAVTPIFTTSYSGLFKSFFDVIDNTALAGIPTVIAATAGSARHSLALDYAMRPMFNYLKAQVVPTGVFAATADWGTGGDDVNPLPERIDRAAAELAPLVAASTRSETPRDPFGFENVLSPVGGFQPA